MWLRVFVEILEGGSSDIQREAGMEPRATPGAFQPSATPRLIPQQTSRAPLNQPLADGREGSIWGRGEGAGGFFYPGRVHQAAGKTDLGWGSMGGQDFQAEGGLDEAVNWAEG